MGADFLGIIALDLYSGAADEAALLRSAVIRKKCRRLLPPAKLMRCLGPTVCASVIKRHFCRFGRAKQRYAPRFTGSKRR